jgi:hypothetical protein
MGIGPGLQDVLSGYHRPSSDPTNYLFAPGTVGKSWGDYLNNLYATPVDQTQPYISGSTAIRDALSREAGGAQDALGRATQAGGYYDSGARLAGLGDINRQKMFAYGQSLSQLLASLEHDRMSAAAPFLASQIGAYNAHENALQGAESAANQRFQTHSENAQAIMKMVGGMAGCWVAEAIFGKESEDTHAARFYVNLIAPVWFRDFYLRYGKRIAAVVSRSRALKAILRPAFLWMGAQTRRALVA